MKKKQKAGYSKKETIYLELVSDIKYLELVQVMVNWLTSQLGFSEEDSFHTALSIGEAVCNAILHGNKKDVKKKVKIKFILKPDKITAIVRDEGKGFDVSKVPNPTEEEHLLKGCGRGIFYMRSFMDEVKFRHKPDGKGMEVSLTKRIKSNANKKLNACQRQDRAV